MTVHEPVRQTTVDVVVPTGCAVGVLLPSIVDAVLGATDAPSEAIHWFLTRPGRVPMDPSATLRDNAVRDGDLVLLTAAPPPTPRVRPGDPAGVVSALVRDPVPRRTGPAAAVGLAVTVTLAAALAWSGWVSEQQSALWVAAALCAGSAVAAATEWAPQPLCTVLSVGAVVQAAVTGALSGVGGTWAPAALLAAGAALLMAVTLARSRTGAATALSGCAATAGAVAAAAGVQVAVASGVGATGALLTVLSLGLLSAAPTLTVVAAGLGPARSTVDAGRAQTAHRILTGSVAGWACTAVAGAVLVAADAGVPRVLAAAFSAVVATLLLLRQRVHADPTRRISLSAAGFAALAVTVWVSVTAAPHWAPWWCAAVAAAGAAALPRWLRGASPNPMSRWVVHLAEYAALAAVVPLAAWVAGVYDAVRAMTLP
ncbi:type VII secretion integral membrane protein EccD [Mycolicibacterium chubuense]|uniref:type VII secretion integral membrane protein EccD n=1 Tax=Mycolicibacterium chubuense TaxID=1800 RepID=UPI0012FEA15D|nr:type VII secretion integral membrane protein EccD [Mycolicibacterium chubuense]